MAGLHIAQRVVEHPDRVLPGALLDAVEGAVDDAFGDRLLAVEHEAVHELGEDDVAEFRIGQDFALVRRRDGETSLCSLVPAYFGRLAPYLERRCLRSLTPCVSSTPRSM